MKNIFERSDKGEIISEKPLNPELQKIVNEFDFGTLKTILEEYGRKAIGEDFELNSVPPEHIHGNAHGRNGIYDPLGGYIGLSYDRIRIKATQLKIDPQLYALRTLIHEEIHAATDHKPSKQDSDLEVHVGYDETHNWYRLFERWNEGVTESLAREVLRKYCEATGTVSMADIENMLNNFHEKSYIDVAYESEVGFVDTVSTYIAKQVGVSKEVARDGIIQGFFSGERLNSEEFRALATDIFPPNFMEDMIHGSAAMTIRRLTKELQNQMDNPDAERRMANSSFVRSLRRSVENYVEMNGRIVP